MLIECARVVRVAGDACWVEAPGAAGCSACASGKGCGGGTMSRLFGDRRMPLRVRVPVELAPAVSDVVEIGMPASGVAGASLLTYLPLLAGLVLGAVLGTVLGGPGAGEGAAIAGAAGGLLLALGALRLLDGPARRLLGEPTVLRILSSSLAGG
ncbi:MAG TPA: SoxR reducing system RseC family protein [Pseudomonadales bacterium]|nr:SoxR reducing system RseC family protein [Pseudomonadales bacterium]